MRPCQLHKRRPGASASHQAKKPSRPLTSQLLDGIAGDDGLAAVGANHLAELSPGADSGLDDLRVEQVGGLEKEWVQ